MSNVNFVNTGKFTAGNRNTVVQAFNAVTPTLTDKIHIYMDGSRARLNHRELLYLNQALIKNYVTPAVNPGNLLSQFPNSQFDASASLKGIAFDTSDGTYWVIDNTSKEIHHLNEDGTAIGSPIDLLAIEGGMTLVRDIAYDPNDSLWFISGNSDEIYNITTAGVLIDNFKSTVYDALATLPGGIAVKANGTLVTSDMSTDKIYNITRLGAHISEFPTSAYDGASSTPSNIDIGLDGSYWILDFGTKNIDNVTDAGSLNLTIDATTIDPGTSTSPFGVAVKANGDLLVVESSNKIIYTTEGKTALTMETLLANGLIQLHLDQVNIYVQD